MVKRDYINIMATITYSPQVTSLVRTVLKLMPMTSLVRMGLKQYVSKDRRMVRSWVLELHNLSGCADYQLLGI